MTETQAPLAPVPDVAATSSSTTHSAAHSALPENLQRFLLTGKVVVVTGFVFITLILFLSANYCFPSGARGLGYCMSEALCEVGCKAIAIMDVLQEHGDSAALELNKKYNIPAAFYKVDVRDAEAVKEVMISVRDLPRSH